VLVELGVQKFLKWFGLGLLGVLLIGPFLVPVGTSGTLTKEQAAAEIWNGQSKWVELAGHEVHYVEAGDPESDRLIVLMHGFGASSYSYRDVLEPLAFLGHVIAYDRAAFGFTERPTTWDINPYGAEGQLQVLDELIGIFGQGKEVFIVGHSAGGNLAASYTVENQEKLAGSVLYAPAVLNGGGGPSWLNWIYSIPQLNHLGPLLVSSIATNGLDLLYRSYNDPSQVDDQTLAGYTQPLKVKGWEKAFWEFNKAPRNTGISERLSEIAIPTLVLTGDNDLVVATADSVTVAGLISGSELVIIPQTGHLPNEESPSEFAAAVIEFVEKN
jgi:pimeloyl-ACP methyl ester carboxylesterase